MNALFERAVEGIGNSGYAVCENFISQELVKSLRNNLKLLFDRGEFHKAGIGKRDNFQKNHEIRGDYIYWIKGNSSPSEIELIDLINSFIEYLNYTCYTGIKSSEFHYAYYPNGTFYKKHVDQFTYDSGRKYTMIFYLNEDWQESDGGQLVLYLNGEKKKILPVGGTLVFFESQKIEHEVLLSKRDRMSVTGWLKNQETGIILE